MSEAVMPSVSYGFADPIKQVLQSLAAEPKVEHDAPESAHTLESERRSPKSRVYFFIILFSVEYYYGRTGGGATGATLGNAAHPAERPVGAAGSVAVVVVRLPGMFVPGVVDDTPVATGVVFGVAMADCGVVFGVAFGVFGFGCGFS